MTTPHVMRPAQTPGAHLRQEIDRPVGDAARISLTLDLDHARLLERRLSLVFEEAWSVVAPAPSADCGWRR
jgi:hypothetical protein